MFRNSINRGHEFDNNLLWLFKLKTLKAHLSYCHPPLSRRFRNCEPILLKYLVRIRIKSRGKHRGPLDSDELSNDVLSSVFRRYFDLFNFNSQVIDSQCEAFEIFSNPNSLPEWLIKFSTVFLTIVNWVERLWNEWLWTWKCTTFKRIPNILIVLTNKDVALIYSVTICQQKTKDCALSRYFQHKLQHCCFYHWCLPLFITSLL